MGNFVVWAAILCAASLASPSIAWAIQCRSTGGHINGERTTAVRQVDLKGRTLTLSGRMDGKPMPRRSLPCVPLHAGVMCERVLGPVTVTVMTRADQMVETVTDTATGAETAGFAYQCERPIARSR